MVVELWLLQELDHHLTLTFIFIYFLEDTQFFFGDIRVNCGITKHYKYACVRCRFTRSSVYHTFFTPLKSVFCNFFNDSYLKYYYSFDLIKNI